MLRRAFVWLVFCAAVSTSLAAATVDGTWKGSVNGPNGTLDLTFVLKTDGERLTGSISSAMGDVAIQNGTVKADVLAFDVDVQGSLIRHTARHAGDQITITATGEWGTTEYVVIRAKAD
jgi:hypothetical protein